MVSMLPLPTETAADRSAAVVGEEPLVPVPTSEVDALRVEIRGERPEGLDRVREQVGAVRVSDLGQGRQIVSVAVAIGDPGHAE